MIGVGKAPSFEISVMHRGDPREYIWRIGWPDSYQQIFLLSSGTLAGFGYFLFRTVYNRVFPE